MAPVMLERRMSALSRRIVAAWRRWDGLVCLMRAMAFRVRADPDTYMKEPLFRLRIR
jgi:hypothetical protein